MSNHDISVILSTYNRACMLEQTLEALSHLDRSGLAVEFVVVDNNSKDDTGRVIESFANRLPIRHLFEPRAGKNYALNHVIDTVELGEIVVFTDDDVVPRIDWLQQIARACMRRTEYSVFGGKIEPIWPEDIVVPRWALESEHMRQVVLCAHDLGDEEVEYVNTLPFGANFWVRKCVFADDRRYDESVGPRPGSYRMGSETLFLRGLVAGGFGVLYIPEAVVGHHTQRTLLSEKGMVGRYIKSGRGLVPVRGINRQHLHSRYRIIWIIRTIAAIVLSHWRIQFFRFTDFGSSREERIALAARCLGYDLESLENGWRERDRDAT